MKKRIAAMLLCGLLLANVTACNYAPKNEVREETEETTIEIVDGKGTGETEGKNSQEESETMPNNEQPTEPNKDNEYIRDLPLNVLREKLGCHVNNESTENLKQLMKKGENDIQVEHDRNLSNVFYITAHQNETEYKTTVSLSNEVRTADIYCGFTSEQNGYIIIFHMEGHAVSPMDDIEIACVKNIRRW